MRYDDGEPKKLPKNSRKRQIRVFCIWETEGVRCGKVFKSFDALKSHIDTVHKEKKVEQRKETGKQTVL